MGDINMGRSGSKLTITVTPKISGVTVTGIEYKTYAGTATRTGEGPWEFTVNNDKVYDGSTDLGTCYEPITLNYTK